MGVFGGPNVSEDGLVLALDVGNRKTFANSLINSTSWSLGSGSATGYSQNGATAENERVTGTDPFGKSATVWETRPQGNNADDGGWNSDSVAIDSTKLYRFSVWVKRTTDSTGGTFYFGTSSNVRRTDNNEYAGNPYWDCRGPGSFTKDVWYLVVGHCYPYNTTYTGQHPETGIYTVAEGTTKVASINSCNIGPDLKWAGSNESATVHRCYHYYCSDNTTRLQFFDPRIDTIDGTEPSIANLLSGFTASRLSDLIGTNNGTFVNSPTYSSANGGSLSFDGSNDYVDIPYLLLSGSQDFTINIWIKANSQVGGTIFANYPAGNLQCFYGQSYIGMWLNNSSAYLDSAGTEFTTNPVFFTAQRIGGNETRVYLNTVLKKTGASTSTIGSVSNFRMGTNTNGSEVYNGNIAQTQIYNRALSAAEIQQNFIATRSRYGI